MPRATIPYQEINKKLKEMFPPPLFLEARVIKPSRYNSEKAPISVYDRRTGNYKVSGYICKIIYARYDGQKVSNYRGFNSAYKDERKTVMVLLD